MSNALQGGEMEYDIRGRLNLSNLPITVGFIASLSGLFVSVGFNSYPEGLSTFPYLLDPFFYFGTLFTHSGLSHYLANVYFLVPAGIVLTFLTNNRKVLYVVLVSHLPTAALCATMGLTALGAGAAAYGVLAAVLVRTTWFCAEDYSGPVRIASSVAVVVLSGTALVSLIVASGGLMVSHVIPVSGFVLGGTFESLRVVYTFGYSDPEYSPIPDYVYFEGPDFRTRWENMTGDPEEAERLKEKYADKEAAPDDTHAGSRGRRRD